MAYNYRRTRRRRYRYSGWSADSHKQRVTRLYGGIDDDVRRMFFNLDPHTLARVFTCYERKYGIGKRRYAEKTFEAWKIGAVQMGGEISDRLVQIVPNFLSFEQKYNLVKKLWDRFRNRTTVNVSISPSSGLEAAISAVMDAIEAVADPNIPPAVAERLEWLAADDVMAARSLLEQIEKRESQVIVETLESELRQLLAVAELHHDKLVSGSRSLTLPSATVKIQVNQSTAPWSTSMNENERRRSEQSKELAARNQQNRDLAPIQNPNDLLSEALRRMSPQKQEEIIGKATDEALRLQVKQKEGKLDHEMAASKVDTASDAASRLGTAGTEFEVRAEHRSEHGSVQVTVRSKKSSLSERVGGCFVATACFGHDAHPAVISLREFRDQYLRNNSAGRTFIAWYYRNSPPLARFIERKKSRRAFVRLFLHPVVLVARAAMIFGRNVNR